MLSFKVDTDGQRDFLQEKIEDVKDLRFHQFSSLRTFADFLSGPDDSLFGRCAICGVHAAWVGCVAVLVLMLLDNTMNNRQSDTGWSEWHVDTW